MCLTRQARCDTIMVKNSPKQAYKSSIIPGEGERAPWSENKDFEYEPEREEETGASKYRLPFALCQAKGIQPQDWWTPRDAWEALKSGGHISDVSEEYKEFYRQKKKEREKQRRKENKAYADKKRAQLKNPEHNPDANYVHKDGAIAGAVKGKPMTFEQADSGNCNPGITQDAIGYRHNCQTCVAVYVARRQGYDVRALPNLNNRNIHDLSYMTNLAYVTKDGQHPGYIGKYPGQKTLVYLNNNVKPGRIYSLEYKYTGKNSGHIITIEKDANGQLRLYDPQTNIKKVTSTGILEYLRKTEGHRLMDLTDVSLDEKFCDTIMKKRR